MSVDSGIDVRQKRSIYRVHYALPKPLADDKMARPHSTINQDKMKIHKYQRQVAGHHNDNTNKRYLGILKYMNGTILKPVIKEVQRREIDFYETMAITSNRDLVELRNYISKYYGWKKFTYNSYESDYLILEDMAEGMLEPCIMDIKIGRRTWDPLATEEKIEAEKSKYAECKRDVAFCIPGFQVFKVATGNINKYNKDYGKKLNGTTVREALRIFLNAQGTKMCRSLVLQFLTELWKIQKWASKQTSVQLYSTSLLLVYDTQRLRECCGESDELRVEKKTKCSTPPAMQPRRRSVHSLPSSDLGNAAFSGQVSCDGPIYRKISSAPTTPMILAQTCFNPVQPTSNTPWHEAYRQLCRSHSFIHNYDENMSKIKMNYRALLDQLSSESPLPKPWVSVKIIDFVHAFFNGEEETNDSNFSEGIDNVVKIFEEFLTHTDEQRVDFSV